MTEQKPKNIFSTQSHYERKKKNNESPNTFEIYRK